MSSAPRQRSHLEYRIGWVSALADELAAAQLMLDETHAQSLRRSNDNNNYTLGSIAGHNVVLLCLPYKKYGKVQAAVAAQQMLETFPNIKYCLMVGIGGGVPSPWDIRLGDVVVSVPTNQESGVIQYDFGKTKGGKLHRQGSLNSPPLVLLNAVSFLLASHQKADEPRFQRYLTEVMQRSDVGVFASCLPDASKDYLFHAAYEHADPDAGCASCDEQHRVQREQRSRPGPQVHYGLIASGDQVMKHAATRDSLAHEHQFKCFEMEAAGLMDNVPCLVVRGISDYCDSHKNDDWHRYAALAAAAYAKDLLGSTAVENEDATCAVAALVQQSLCTRELNAWIRGTEDVGIYDELSANLQRRHGSTCSWLLSDQRFQTWADLKSTRNVLWYNAPIASGKSVLSTIVHEHFKKQNLATAYFGYSFKNRSQRKAVNGLRSLAIQLINYPSAKLPQAALELQAKEMLDPQAQFMRDAVAGELLCTVLQPLNLVYVVVDGLDECDDQNVAFQEFSAVISRKRYGTVKWFFTSRPEARIQRFLTKMHAVELAPTPSVICSDIRTYLRDGLFELQYLSDPTDVGETFNEKQVDKWVEKCDGSFLYARLMYLYWQTITRLADLATFVDMFPSSLSGYYMSTLQRLCKRTAKERNLARRTFMYLTYSEKSMTWRELRNAIAIDYQVKEYKSDHIPTRETILQLCGSFLTTDKMHEAQDDEDAMVRFCHKTVHDFFLVESARVSRQESSSDDEDEETKRLHEFFPSFAKASVEIGVDCIWFLSYKRYSTAAKMHKILLANNKEDAFLRYSATSWFRHLMETPPKLAPVTQVRRFLQTSNFWACVTVQTLVSPYLFGTYRTILKQKPGRRAKIVGFQMGVGSTLSHAFDGFGHPLPGWLENFDFEAKLSRQFYCFVADWHNVLTGSPDELKQCITLSSADSALFSNLACSKTISAFHFAEQVDDCSELAYLSPATPFLDDRRLHVEMLYSCKDDDSLRYRQVSAFSKRSMAERTIEMSGGDDATSSIVYFGRRSDEAVDVWYLNEQPLRIKRIRDGIPQVFEAPSLWQTSRTCCTWRVYQRDIHRTAIGKVVVLHMLLQMKTDEHDTAATDALDSNSDFGDGDSDTRSEHSSNANESDDDDDDDTQSESSAAFSGSSSQDGSESDWQMDMAEDEFHPFYEGVILLSESLDPLWIPFKKVSPNRTPFRAAVHPISGKVVCSAFENQNLLDDVDLGEWHVEKFDGDEHKEGTETLGRELRFSACGQYLYSLCTSLHRQEQLMYNITLRTYQYSDDKGYNDLGAPQTISRRIAESLAEQLSDYILLHWSPEEVIVVLPSLNSRRKLIKFPLRTDGATAPQTAFVLERPIFLPSGITSHTKIFYQAGRPQRPHRLFLYLQRKPESDGAEGRSIVDPVAIQWEIAQGTAWREWDQTADGALEGWDQECDLVRKLRGMYIDEGKKFSVPIRSGLDWTLKAFLSCF